MQIQDTCHPSNSPLLTCPSYARPRSLRSPWADARSLNLRWSVITFFLIFALSQLMIGCGRSSQAAHDTVASPDRNLKESTADSPSEPSQDPSTEIKTPTSVKLKNLDQIQSAISGLKSLYQAEQKRRVTIAIFDNGFMGLPSEINTTLPPDLKIESFARNQPEPTVHGTRMAQLVYALAHDRNTYHGDSALKLDILLYNTNGFSNLKDAIDQVIEKDVDMVLYSQIWEYGGNGYGSGFINKEISRATDAGIIWINAAGNYGLSHYSAFARVQGDQSLKLPYLGRYLRFVVSQDNTPIKTVLSWSDFSDEIHYRTAIDLDFEIYNQNGTMIAESKLIQNGIKQADDPQQTDHAREILKLNLKQGIYYLVVKTKNEALSPQLRFQLSMDGMGVVFLDRNNEDSVMVPADHPSVLAIGALDVAYTSTRRFNNLFGQNTKPDLWTISDATFDDGLDVRGTSTAAAITAGALARWLGTQDRRVRQRDLWALLRQGFLSRSLPAQEFMQSCQSDEGLASFCQAPRQSMRALAFLPW